MATSTMHAANGANMNWNTVSGLPGLAAGARGLAERLRERGDDGVDEIEERVYAGGAAHVRRHDHGLGAGALGHLIDLVVVEVARRQQDPHVSLLHQGDQLPHV